MLVSFSDLIKLEKIPRDFPNMKIHQSNSIHNFTDILLCEFQDVLSNKLNPIPMKTDKTMHMTLNAGATPKNVLSVPF